MSRIGNAPIPLPVGVSAEVNGNTVTVRGPRGQLARALHPTMTIRVADAVITVARPSDAKPHREMHGLTRTLVANMVTGVSAGYQKVVELYGVGYRVQQQGSRLTLQIGFSHPVLFDLPEGISAQVDSFVPTSENQYLSSRITFSGIDKEVLGQTAATLRATRKPEPYKGKGFRYRGEVVRRKPGKAAQAR